MKRRELLKTAAGASAFALLPHAVANPAQAAAGRVRPQTRKPKKVVIAGGGIAGLSCAYELHMRGHDVTLLEAAGRTGGHVKTIHDPLADGLYADVGAEHFTKPGYDLYWGYVREFGLTALYYPHREHILRYMHGRFYTEQDLANPKILAGFGLNQREIDYLARHPWWDLASLYLAPYLGAFHDEYQPFAAGLNHLDNLSFSDLLKRDGASPAAIGFVGSNGSALHVIWHAAVLKLRGVPLAPPVVYRLQGGNQSLPNAFAARLMDRIRLGAPVTGLEHGASGVRVHYREFGRDSTLEADYAVCCMNAYMLRRLPVTPAWPAAKKYAVNTVAYDMYSRVAIQCQTPFWEKDHVSPNWETSNPDLSEMWRMAEEVKTPRAILVATAANSASVDDASKALASLYPGKSLAVEQAVMQKWADEPYAMACETVTYAPGDLQKMWPAIMEPVGRVYFAGAYTDNLNWGQEAATRSANRVAEQIDRA
jgi:monoamine oxidase